MKNNKEIKEILKKKLEKFEEILQKMMKYNDKLKTMDIIKSSEVSLVFSEITKLYEKINKGRTNITLELVQEVNNDLSNMIRSYGCYCFEDFIYVCFNSNYLSSNLNDTNTDIYNLLKDFFHPINYKVIIKNKTIEGQTGTITEDFAIVNSSKTFDAFDNVKDDSSFQENVHGIKIIMHDVSKKISIIVHGIVDDILFSVLNNEFIDKKTNNLKTFRTTVNHDLLNKYDNYIKSLTLKDFLIYDANELYDRFTRSLSYIHYLMTAPLKDVIKNFMEGSYMDKREILINLLINNENSESEYLAYLLYDILNKETENSIDSQEQILLYDNLPINYKNIFRFAMKNTLNYTEKLYNINESVPLEQQICLMKVDDNVKEKAMMKLKEVKSKSEDSGSKARQYLEGLLKIPFGVYTKEEIMNTIECIMNDYTNFLKFVPNDFYMKNEADMSLLKIKTHMKILEKEQKNIEKHYMDIIRKKVESDKKDNLINYIKNINYAIKNGDFDYKKINFGKLTSTMLKKEVKKVLDVIKIENVRLISPLFRNHDLFIKSKSSLQEKIDKMNTYMKDVDSILNESVYGHLEAKKQIKRIIGQWMVGENNGYCFGFEGPPGVGKTSLAQKGISKCLIDKNSKSRPFSFIAIGGSSNGSTLEGHNYTYVGATWGKIVDILMDSKCMNPIIFIDELDKISNTEHGKEIIGILTHLIDSSQNMNFQDKYFNGIDLDLSKVLFIFSYNDVSLIDRILLDRIHRIKFERLTVLDKITITREHLIPEINKKLALYDDVAINDENIRYIINNYTNESGVRKLKEILFEIFSEINLNILTNMDDETYPLELTPEIIDKYLKSRYKKSVMKIVDESRVGVVNGLWANSLGQGGILPMECVFVQASGFMDMKLTGMQGDVMKESMDVAKTLVWSLLNEEERKVLKDKKESGEQGIHIHCPDGATRKDGPSAGTAITVLIYSLLTNKRVNNEFAITGEINLLGQVTEIGGLDQKIIGGIEAGVKHFIYPHENQKDFEKFQEKYKESSILENIHFYKVKRIEEVLELIIIN